MSRKSSRLTLRDADLSPPFETEKLRTALKVFLERIVEDPVSGHSRQLGAFKWGVYAFYDYDGEPIYVGQTNEQLSTRIRRHLTNQRTDAVAMNVLDPFEVFKIRVWPLPQFQERVAKDIEAARALNALEYSVFQQALKESHFGAVLNEKRPSEAGHIDVPPFFEGVIVDRSVEELRRHPDVRIARRAATLARLAQVISERKVQSGLRQTLLTQAKRLQWLAQRRVEDYSGVPEEDSEE